MRGEFGGKEGNLQACCRVATVYGGSMLILESRLYKANRFNWSQQEERDRHTEQRGPPKKFLPYWVSHSLRPHINSLSPSKLAIPSKCCAFVKGGSGGLGESGGEFISSELLLLSSTGVSIL